MHYDEVFSYLGKYNRYLWTSFLLVALSVMSEALHSMIQVFLLVQTDHWCYLNGSQEICNQEGLNNTECSKQLSALRPADNPETLIINETRCSQYDYTNFTLWSNLSLLEGTEQECENGWQFDNSQYKSTATEEFELVCESAQLVSVAMSSAFFGVMISAPFLGNLSDRYGRKRLIVISYACFIVLDFISAFSPSYWVYVTLRFIAATFYAGVFMPGYVYASEVVGPTERSLSTSIAGSFWALGYVITAIYAYFIRHWRTLLKCICVADVIILLAIIFLVPESHRWLHSVGRFDEADEINRKASEYGEEIPPEVYQQIREQKVEGDGKTEVTNATVKDLFLNKVIFTRTMVIITIWFILNLVYYGVSLGAISLSSNDYITVALSAAVEIPACLFSRYFIDRWGRRPVLGFFFTTSGISCIGIAFTSNWLVLIFGLIGKFSISSCYNIQSIFSAENYPTPVRNVGVGIGNMAGSLGSVLAPFMMYIGELWQQLPYFIFAGLSGVAALLLLLLPETRGTNLPQSIQEGEKLGTKKSVDINSDCSVANHGHDAPFDVLKLEEI